MTIQSNKFKLPSYVNFIIILFGAILFFFLLIIGSGIIIPLAFAFLFSLFLYPFVKKMEKRFPRWLSIILALLVVIIICIIIFFITYNSILSFSKDYPEMERGVKRLISSYQKVMEEELNITSKEQGEFTEKSLNNFMRTGGKFIAAFLGSIATFFTYIFLIPIYTFFMLYYRHIFKEFLIMVIKDEEQEKRAIIIEEQIIQVVQKYVVGLFTVILIITILNVIGLWIIGIKHAIFFGALAALLTIIPYIGVFIGSLLPILFALVMKDSLFYPIAVFVWFQIVQTLEGNFITPSIVGSQVSLNPLIAIVALLIGASVWGIAGMILFTPLTAILKVILDNIPETEPYGHLLGEGHKK